MWACALLYPVLQPLTKACLSHLQLTDLVSLSSLICYWHDKMQKSALLKDVYCVKSFSLSILSSVAPVDVGDDLFGLPVMNCCLVQMAHCCIYCPCPFNNTIWALATVTSSVLQPTLCMRVTAVSLCACISSTAAKFLTVFGLYCLAIMQTDVA